MKIDKKLLEVGINENVINYFHDKSKNKEFKIVSAKKNNYGNINGNIVVDLVLSNEEKVQYNINLQNYRQKLINKTLNKI